MNTTRIHIFKPGTHTSMGGQTLAFSEADLAATVAAYDPSKHEAPIVVGHPTHDAPAYGWVKSLTLEADGLHANAGQLDPQFAELVRDGKFKKVSASFYPPDSPNAPTSGVYYLRHVGFLGAQPPAIKGLKQVDFADAGNMVSIEMPIHFAEQTEETTVTPEEKAAIEAENTALKAQIAANQAAFAKAKQEHIHASNLAFADSLSTSGKLKDSDKAVVIAVLDHLASADQPIEFSEGEGKPAKPLLEAYKATLQASVPAVAFGEVATHTTAAATGSKTAAFDLPPGYRLSEADQAHYTKVHAYAEANKLSIIEAATALQDTQS